MEVRVGFKSGAQQWRLRVEIKSRAWSPSYTCYWLEKADLTFSKSCNSLLANYVELFLF